MPRLTHALLFCFLSFFPQLVTTVENVIRVNIFQVNLFFSWNFACAICNQLLCFLQEFTWCPSCFLSISFQGLMDCRPWKGLLSFSGAGGKMSRWSSVFAFYPSMHSWCWFFSPLAVLVPVFICFYLFINCLTATSWNFDCSIWTAESFWTLCADEQLHDCDSSTLTILLHLVFEGCRFHSAASLGVMITLLSAIHIFFPSVFSILFCLYDSWKIFRRHGPG